MNVRQANQDRPQTLGQRLTREEATLAAMMAIYCRSHHGQHSPLCADCAALLDYARRRLATCPFGEEKPACNHCQVHCYSALQRERVKSVMRYAGPRMPWRHPLLSLYHLLDKRRKAPSLAWIKQKHQSHSSEGP